MAERATAERQLARILDLIPRAAREQGAALADLAGAVGTSEQEVLDDLMAVYTRAYYQPAGVDDDVQIMIEDDRVEVWTKGEFRRPVRLNARESLAVRLGLRVMAAGAEPARATELTALVERLEQRLLDGRDTAGVERFEVGPSAVAPSGPQQVIADAARESRRCRISYLKPGASGPEEREIDPYVLLVASGQWYTIGHCHRSEGIRVFRLDRVLAATPIDGGFEVPADFDASAYVSEGRVYRAEEFEEVVVRYSPRIAPWILEEGAGERLDDGSVLVRYAVSDRNWLIRHVLEHGPDAGVLSPESVRAEVAAVLRRITERG